MDTSARDMSLALLCAFRGFALLLGAFAARAGLRVGFFDFLRAMTFSDEDRMVELVNSSAYGLANSVWSSDLERANRVAERLVAGNSWINAHNLFAHGMPYGGCNLSGCGGGVLGPETLSDYLRNQTVARVLA